MTSSAAPSTGEPSTGPLPVHLADWVARRALTHPDHPAIEAADVVRSDVGGSEAGVLRYADLERRVAAAAAGLSGLGLGALGVEPGEPVGVLMGNSATFAVFAHAVPRAGGLFMPLNARLTTEEVAWQLRDSGARFLVADAEHLDAASRAAEAAGVRLLEASDARWSVHEPGAPQEIEVDPATAHSVIYTSGTSGRPKGALLTHGNTYASAIASAANIGVEPSDRWLACMPLFHIGGLSILLRSAIYGTTAVIHDRFDEVRVNVALRHEDITLLSVVAAMLQRMFDADADAGGDLEAYPDTVRAVLLGGGPAPEPLLETARDRGLPVLQTYGLTEAASQVATLAPADALRKLGSAGLPLPGTTVRIDLDGREAAPGETGEILVAGPTVSPGYLHRDASHPDGWLHTGDLGSLEDEGYLYVADRRDDLVVTGGENVYPAEVEAAILAFEGVAECAVVGVPDAAWGHAVAALVVPREGAPCDIDALRAFLRDRLAGYKQPRRIELTSEPLPRTSSGKLLRRVVRERMGDRG